MKNKPIKRRFIRNRAGTATVEFAIVAPVFTILLLGLWQASSLYEVQNQLSMIVREGARVATLERSEVVPIGMTTNEKVTSDIRTLLQVHGFDDEQATISITHMNDPDTEFDLDDPENDLGYFRVTVEYPCFDKLKIQSQIVENYTLSADIVFRNGYAQVVQ